MYDSIIEKLNSQIDNKKTVHAYLFEINNYDEDYKVVLNFVKMLLSNLKYDEVIVTVNTRNKVLTEVLIARCLECLNEGVEFND